MAKRMTGMRESARRGVRMKKKDGPIGRIVRGVMAAAAICAVLVAAFAWLLSIWQASEGAVRASNQCIKFVSILTGVTVCVGRGGEKGALLKSGIDAMLEAVRFDQKLEGVDLVVTGEGRIDGQSVRFGKVPVGVAKRCAARNIPVIAIVGGIGDGAEGLFDICESTIQTTVSGPMSLQSAMENAAILYENAADRVFRAVRIGMSMKN